MNIVFYSTNSNFYDAAKIQEYFWPTKKQEWEQLAQEFPEHNFFVASQMPALFLVDTTEGVFGTSPNNVKYVCLIKQHAQDIAQEILDLHPDAAFSASFWVTPYDWLPLQDALVAQILAEHGVKTVCPSADSAFSAFDKWQTHLLLEKHGFSIPNAVYVHHELFWCERGNKEIKTNVYKDYVLSAIQKLKLPLIIKDTVGLSSYGAEVVPTYKAAAGFLQSHKNSSDRIVEEYVSGFQFGTEIHGTPGSYTVMPPFMFSVNQYGITSPKQSVKAGPVTSDCFKIAELNDMLVRLAEELGFSGIVQVDLVFSPENGGKWYILEINPRLSGMSELYARAQGLSLCKILLKIVLGQPSEKLDCACNIKFPLLSVHQLAELHELPFVKYIHQIHNLAARQKRETGYCELIFTGKNFVALEENLNRLESCFPDAVEPAFIQKARELMGILKESICKNQNP